MIDALLILLVLLWVSSWILGFLLHILDYLSMAASQAASKLRGDIPLPRSDSLDLLGTKVRLLENITSNTQTIPAGATGVIIDYTISSPAYLVKFSSPIDCEAYAWRYQLACVSSNT